MSEQTSPAPIRTVRDILYRLPEPLLGGRRQWCVYRTEPDGKGGLRKIITPAADLERKASNKRPADWCTAPQAVDALAASRLWGEGLVGLVFAAAADSDLALIDIDKVRDPESGMLTSEGAAIVAPFVGRAYLEVSPSGRGVHIIARAPGVARMFAKVTHEATAFAGPWEVQVSAGGQPQFLTITGYRPDEWFVKYDGLVDCTDEVRALIADIDEARARRATSTKATPPPPRVASSPSSGADIDAADAVILERVRRFRMGSRALEGDLTPWGGDHSRADAALAFALRRAGATESQARALFEASPLYRPDKRPYRLHGTGEPRPYVDNLIADAFAKCDGWKDPTPPRLVAGGATSTSPTPPPAVGQASGCDEHEARIADLEATVAALEAEVSALREDQRQRVALISAAAAVRRNRALPESVRNVAVAAAQVIARAGADIDEAAEDDGDTAAGLFPVRLPVLADIAGTSTSTASKGLKALAAAGALRVETRSEPVTFPDADGVLREGRALRIFIGAPTSTRPTDVVSMLSKAATAAPESPRNHGGRRLPRPTCPDHPDAGLIVRTITACGECGLVLEEAVARTAAKGGDEPRLVGAGIPGSDSCKMEESDSSSGAPGRSLSSLQRQDERIGGPDPLPRDLEADTGEVLEVTAARSSHLEIIRNGAENSPADPFAASRAAYFARIAAEAGPPPDGPTQASLFDPSGGAL